MPLNSHDTRPATAADVPTILQLIQQLAVYEKLEHMVSGNVETLNEALFGEKPSCECVLISEAGKTIGFALYFMTFSTFLCKSGLYLEDLFVVPEARGRGHGKALLIYLAQLSRQRGCGRFEWRVLDWNKPAVDFYRSLGADIMPEWYLVRMTENEIAKLAAEAISLR